MNLGVKSFCDFVIRIDKFKKLNIPSSKSFEVYQSQITLFFRLNIEINCKDQFCFTNFAVRNIIFMHKAGFVNIVGKPNAGKSTLLNQLMGEKLAIVTQKAQTTRHRIFGIYNEDDLQIVFSDTPGVLDPKYGLQEKMMDFVKIPFRMLMYSCLLLM